MEQAVDIFSALADPTRRHIIQMLAGIDMAAGEVAARVDGMSRPAVVKHLNILRGAGVIVTEQRGRTRVNQLDITALDEVARWTAEVGRFWDARLGALKEAVEANYAAEQNSTKKSED